tara:strand:+ start:31425 stop:32297 length:873 start_codon:yes stop_codon:yes gene_type:complete
VTRGRDSSLHEIAYAKLNLALHVRNRREDGYHDIETLFAFCADGDVLRVSPSDDLTLDMEGPFAAVLAGDADNLVLRAAHILAEACGERRGAALTLDKRLPVASGIGGGSADAAAALRLLNRHWGLNWSLSRLAEIGFSLGADVPACVHSVAVRGEGVGERLDPGARLTDLTDLPVLLVNPLTEVSTAAVFRNWDGVDRGALGGGPALPTALAGRNDLAAPARKIAPVIDDVLNMLEAAPGATLVRMSGSGATCFALFESGAARDAAQTAVRSQAPEWWSMASHLHNFCE